MSSVIKKYNNALRGKILHGTELHYLVNFGLTQFPQRAKSNVTWDWGGEGYQQAHDNSSEFADKFGRDSCSTNLHSKLSMQQPNYRIRSGMLHCNA
jgi:hypothetical protein